MQCGTLTLRGGQAAAQAPEPVSVGDQFDVCLAEPVGKKCAREFRQLRRIAELQRHDRAVEVRAECDVSHAHDFDHVVDVAGSSWR